MLSKFSFQRVPAFNDSGFTCTNLKTSFSLDFLRLYKVLVCLIYSSIRGKDVQQVLA